VSDSQSVLSVRGLEKSFGALRVSQGIDLELARGARVGLIGPNGAGKTTLINLLTGSLKPDGGTIALGGREIQRLRAEQRVRHGLARTHQINALLLEFSALDNVAMAVAEHRGFGWRMLRSKRVWRQCQEEAEQYLLPMNLGAVLDRTVSHMAYGQQRLLEIAIALALQPSVLLLDEPAAGVAAGEARAIHEQLHRLPAHVAVLMVEHDMDLVFSFAQEIVVMILGSILVRGTPAQIERGPRVRDAYLGKARA